MYYDDDINMIYQSSTEEAGQSLKKLADSITDASFSFEEVSEQLSQLGININNSTYNILNNMAKMWEQICGGVGNQEICRWTVSRSDEEIDNSDLNSDLEIFDEKLEKNKFLIFDPDDNNEYLKFD